LGEGYRPPVLLAYADRCTTGATEGLCGGNRDGPSEEGPSALSRPSQRRERHRSPATLQGHLSRRLHRLP